MKKPSDEKIARHVAKVRARNVKERRRLQALEMEPMLLAGIAAFSFVIGLMIGSLLVMVLL